MAALYLYIENMGNKFFRAAAAIWLFAAISFAQDEGGEKIYSNVIVACEDDKKVKAVLDIISKKNAKVIDAYDKSERGERAKYERNASEIDITQAEGLKAVNAYTDCMKAKMQGKAYANQSNKLTVDISVTNDGRLINISKAVNERPVKKGRKTTVQKPKITMGKSIWCEDELNKCLRATIVIDQK